MGDMPPGPGGPELTEAELGMIMHIELPILAGHVLMGTDMLESMGQLARVGNTTTINLEVDSRAEADRLYAEPLRGRHRRHRAQRDALGLVLGLLPRPVRHPLDVQSRLSTPSPSGGDQSGICVVRQKGWPAGSSRTTKRSSPGWKSGFVAPK